MKLCREIIPPQFASDLQYHAFLHLVTGGWFKHKELKSLSEH